MTERTFGVRDPDRQYLDRPGAYLIAIENGFLHIVRTARGIFLPGGGIEGNESHEDCIRRECLEETGYDVTVDDYVCSADTYCEHESIGAFHPIQYYFSGTFRERITEPTDNRTVHGTIGLTELDRLYAPMQRWAAEQCLEMLRADAHGSDDEDL